MCKKAVSLLDGLSGESKSTAKRAGYARKKTCRQTLVVLQHENVLRETSEFRSHGAFLADWHFDGNIAIHAEMLGQRVFQMDKTTLLHVRVCRSHVTVL